LKPDYFGIRGKYVLLLPRGTDAEPNRRWPEEKYVDLARRIARQGVTPVVLGGPEERPIGAAIAKAEPNAKNLVTRPDFAQCVGLAERASFAVGDDVDLMHVAAAAGAPCLVFLSSLNHPERAAPRGRSGVVALTAAVIADLPVEQVDAQLRNCGVYRQAATA
jgi:ADP-heptose:LPS heptosyltransferase